MTTPINQHEGKKYLRRIYSAAASEGVEPEHDSIEVDFYAIAVACNITCPAIAHAAKKILFPGQRGKGSIIDDLKGAIAALNRAIELEELRLKTNG